MGIEGWPIVGIGKNCRTKHIRRRVCSFKTASATHTGIPRRGEKIRGKGPFENVKNAYFRHGLRIIPD